MASQPDLAYQTPVGATYLSLPGTNGGLRVPSDQKQLTLCDLKELCHQMILIQSINMKMEIV